MHHLVPETEALDLFTNVKHTIITQHPDLNTPIPSIWIHSIPSILGMTHGADAGFYFHVDVTVRMRFTWQDVLDALEAMWAPVSGREQMGEMAGEGEGEGEDPYYRMDVGIGGRSHPGRGYVVARVGFGNLFDP